MSEQEMNEVVEEMKQAVNPVRNKLASRKFWMSVAAFLGSIGTAIVGLSLENEKIILVGVVASILSQGIYAACEAYVDAAKKEQDQ